MVTPSVEIETSETGLIKRTTNEQGEIERWPSFAELRRWFKSKSKSYWDLYRFADALLRILEIPPKRSTVEESEPCGGSRRKLDHDA